MNTALSLLVAAAASLAVMSIFLGLQRLFKPEGELGDRLDDLRGADAFRQLSKRMNLEQRLSSQTRLQLVQADVALTVNEYTLVRLGAALAGALLGAVLLRSILFALPVGVLGFQLPVFWLSSRRRKRQQQFQAQLVDVLSMLVSGLRAGVGLMQAMDLVRREMPAPSSSEFGAVVREVSLGASLDEALTHLQERMPSDDLAMVVTVIKIQAEVGGNLATVLDGVVETIRERVRIVQEIRTLTAQQRITGYVLAGMPFFVGGAVMVINPGFMAPLFSPQWIWLPGIAVVMIVMGFIVIGKIVDIKV